MEFIGDSITAGLGSLGAGWDGADPCNPGTFTNSYSVTWSNLLCQAFEAECSILAWSGIAMYEGYGGATMPQLYDYTLPSGPYQNQTTPNNDWNFTSWVPQAVVINLGTNDWCCGHAGNATFAAQYAQTYIDFIQHVAAKYQDTQAKAIQYFLAAGPMQTDADLVEATQFVITNLSSLGYTASFLNLTISNYNPIGCQWHPSAPVHSQMASQAQEVIWRAMNWTCANCW